MFSSDIWCSWGSLRMWRPDRVRIIEVGQADVCVCINIYICILILISFSYRSIYTHAGIKFSDNVNNFYKYAHECINPLLQIRTETASPLIPIRCGRITLYGISCSVPYQGKTMRYQKGKRGRVGAGRISAREKGMRYIEMYIHVCICNVYCCMDKKVQFREYVVELIRVYIQIWKSRKVFIQ